MKLYTQRRDEDNARLIAAAPMLLDALRDLARFTGCTSDDMNPNGLRRGPMADKVRAAISAAERE